MTTRCTYGIFRSFASFAACFTTCTELNVGSVISSAWLNPSASARPKCSTPAWVSIKITSFSLRLIYLITEFRSVFSGQRQPAAAWTTVPITRIFTPSGPVIPKRSTTSDTSGFSESISPRPSPGRAPVFSST